MVLSIEVPIHEETNGLGNLEAMIGLVMVQCRPFIDSGLLQSMTRPRGHTAGPVVQCIKLHSATFSLPT